VQGISRDAREIFEYFTEFIGQLGDASLLYKVVQKVRATDLSSTI
jgi:type I restriction enzyme M protein